MSGRAVQIHLEYPEENGKKERRFQKPVLATSIVEASDGLEGSNGSPEKVSTSAFVCQNVQGYAEFDADHQAMYKHGILHRNISPGNIIIQPASLNVNLPLAKLGTHTRGRLIDLDHAKHTSQKTASRTVGSRRCIFKNPGVPVELEIAASRFYPTWAGATYYYENALDINILKANLNGDLSSSTDLGWEDVGEVPDYESHAPDPGNVIECTGTLPFISHQLLIKKVGIVHNAIHDLESFWWVVVYLCLTRESGGNHQRKDVTEELHTLVRDLFETSNDSSIGINKAIYFDKDTGDASFEKLLKHFHNYFSPLEPMPKRWRDVLVLGYTFGAYEYHLVHKYVLIIIADAIDSLPIAQDRSTVIDSEIRRREEDYEHICRQCTDPSTDNTSTPTRNRWDPPSSPLATNPYSNY